MQKVRKNNQTRRSFVSIKQCFITRFFLPKKVTFALNVNMIFQMSKNHQYFIFPLKTLSKIYSAPFDAIRLKDERSSV